LVKFEFILLDQHVWSLALYTTVARDKMSHILFQSPVDIQSPAFDSYKMMMDGVRTHI